MKKVGRAVRNPVEIPVRERMTQESGMVLIIVLWALFFLSALAVAVYGHIAAQVDLVERLKDRPQLHYLAEAGVKAAMFALEEDKTKDYDALNEVWANNEEGFSSVKVGDVGTFSVKYETMDSYQQPEDHYGLIDEESKINLNTASVEVLKTLFEVAGETTSQTASDIAESIADWVDEDDEPHTNGAEEGYYLSLSPAYSCKNAEFQVLDELLFVKGMDTEIFEKVKDYLTVHSNGTVNINTAGTVVLRALGMDAALADKVVKFRAGVDGQEGTQDDGVFENTDEILSKLDAQVGLSEAENAQVAAIVAAKVLGVRSDNFYGESFGYTQDGTKSARVVFIFNRSREISYWQED